MNKLVSFLRVHVVRVLALVAIAAPVVSAAVSRLPWGATAGISAGILVAGEYAQRLENEKTLRALLTERP